MSKAAVIVLAAALAAAPAAARAPKDKKPPTVPQQLTAVPSSSTHVDLTWKPSKDNVAVAGYRVYRNGAQPGTAPGPSYSATGLAPATLYSFRVAAYDAAGNVSKQSKAAGTTTPSDPGSPPAGLPLLGPSDLVYRGAFLLPEQVSDTETFSYGGTALAYNPAQNSLFAVGHDWYQLTAEVTIPGPVDSSSLDDLNRAAFLQPFKDATSGKADDTGGTNNKIGGQLVYQGKLYGSVYVYYDAAGEQVVSHWARPSTSLTSGTAAGLFQVGNDGAGLVSGYLGEIPPGWRSAFGGSALTGNCCIPIISRTSFGPSAFAFDPTRLGTTTVTPDAPLVYYPQDHPSLGDWNGSWDPSNGLLFNGNSTVRGVVFPTGSSTVLFFGTQGTGPFCYGEGTDDPSLDGLPTPDGTIWCYDPDDSYKGTHGYPYVAEVWAYDANDLAAARNGTVEPWDVKPYATWTLSLPFGSGRIGGAAYDPLHGLLYLSQQYGNGADPVIHVFAIT